MSELLNRRAVLKGTATAMAGASAAVSIAAIGNARPAVNTGDERLFAQLKRWQASAVALDAQGNSFDGTEPNYEELQAAFDDAVQAHDALTFEALAEPATTLAGLLAKARVMDEQGVFDPRTGFQDLMEAAGQALLNDLKAVHGGLVS